MVLLLLLPPVFSCAAAVMTHEQVKARMDSKLAAFYAAVDSSQSLDVFQV